MAVVQAQVAANGTPATPVELFEATADCVVNIFCVNRDAAAQTVTVEIRLLDAGQTASQIIVPGTSVPPGERIVEGPIYLANTDTVFVYGSDADLSFHLYGQTL